MLIRLLFIMLNLTAGFIVTTGNVQAAQDHSMNLLARSEAENTGRNVRDKSGKTLTPEDQKETESDVKVTAEVRKAVVADDTLSTNAKNVKIISHNGTVTLRGTVENEAERVKIQQIVRQTAGVKQVDNQLEIKAP